ncbi:MAG: hypothetical protein U0172_09065 [Nitrospiraceae bacterium]
MKRHLHSAEDLAWLLRYTHAFRGGRIVECHVVRRLLFDERLECDIVAGTSVTLTIRYDSIAPDASPQRVHRIAQLRCYNVSDFSFFEQEGTDSGRIDAVQAERLEGCVRFWFDQYGEVYVVCEAVEFEEVALPGSTPVAPPTREWAFQAREGQVPTVEWILSELERRRLPCQWTRVPPTAGESSHILWSGRLTSKPLTGGAANAGGSLSVRAYGPIDSATFAMALRVDGPEAGGAVLLTALAEILTRHFAGERVTLTEGLPWAT